MDIFSSMVVFPSRGVTFEAPLTPESLLFDSGAPDACESPAPSLGPRGGTTGCSAMRHTSDPRLVFFATRLELRAKFFDLCFVLQYLPLPLNLVKLICLIGSSLELLVPGVEDRICGSTNRVYICGLHGRLRCQAERFQGSRSFEKLQGIVEGSAT